MPLDPEVEAYLRREAASGLPPRSERTLEQTREFYRRAAALSGTAPEMASVEDWALPEEGRAIPCRLYRPHRDGQPRPLIVYLHGGRFISGDLITHDPVGRQLSMAADALVALVDYRLAPEHPFPAAVEDAWAATCALARQAAELGANPKALIIAGDSAGGNLAAATLLKLKERGGADPAAAVLIYPMLDATCSLPSHQTCGRGYGAGSEDMQAGYRQYLPETADLRDPLVSPLFAPSLDGWPPTFVLTAEYDSLRDEAEALAGRLLGAGGDVRLKRYSGAIHGFFQMGGVMRLGREAMEDVAAFVKAAAPPWDRAHPARL